MNEKSIDLTAPPVVEVSFQRSPATGQYVMWVNTLDGCILRICRPGHIVVEIDGKKVLEDGVKQE